MADSEENNNLNKIFMSSKILSTKGKTKIIPNTPQNLYINGEYDLKSISNTSKSKKSDLNQVGGKKLTSTNKTSTNKTSNKTSTNKTSTNKISTNGTTSRSSSTTTSILDMLKARSASIVTDQTKSIKLIKSTLKQAGGEETEEKSDTESETGSVSDDSETESISTIDEIDPNEEPEDEYEKHDEQEEGDPDVETELEEVDEPEVATEYNEDAELEKTIESDDEEEDDCLYQYDDLVDERDTERQPILIEKADRTTDPQMTHYERVRVLGIRAKQIAMDSEVMAKYDGNLGAVELAKYELNYKTTPLIIKRSLPDNTYELWKVSELNIDEDDTKQIIAELNESFKSNKNFYQIY
jgi:DNA-directed RNA polymerase I, II, and III subunit RPABC2